MVEKKKDKENRVRDRPGRAYESTKEKIEDAKERTKEYFSDHPMSSVAIAAGVSAAVAVGVTALLLRPRRKSFIERLLDVF